MERNQNFFRFEELNVYQKALSFLDHVHTIAALFPAHEMYGLSSHFKRAAHSIVFNIAEGSGNNKEQYINNLKYSKGSVKEAIICSEIACRQGYITEENKEEIRERLIEISKMVSGLIASLKRKEEHKSNPSDELTIQ
jgi:four helix bundle protein